MAKTSKRAGVGPRSKDALSKALLLGFGLADVTKDKVEKFVREIKRDYKVTPQESKKVVDQMFKAIDENRKDFEKFLRSQVKKVVNELDLATKEDLRRFKKKR